REWRQGSDILLVSDARGIIFIANQDGWRYRELQPLTSADRAMGQLLGSDNLARKHIGRCRRGA
ncbi:hypothetical protein EI534_48500, partial [Pseudomonas frederiksbergensis]|nr:hypothetical protein [Pseudomonas frederiksbergensis]